MVTKETADGNPGVSVCGIEMKEAQECTVLLLFLL